MKLGRKIELMINSFRIHTKILGMLPTIKLFFKKHFLRKKELKVFIKGKDVPIYLRNFTSDIRVFGQLIINEEYKDGIDLLNPKVILDCGANIGLASIYFTDHFRDAVIHAFEPESSNYILLNKNVHQYKNIRTYKKAIWNETTTMNIIPDTSYDSFSVKVSDGNDVNEVVDAISLNDFIDQNQISTIDLLKIDIEGAELQLFSKNLEWLTKTQVIIVEIHERFNPGSTKFINDILEKDFTISYTGEYVKYSRKH